MDTSPTTRTPLFLTYNTLDRRMRSVELDITIPGLQPPVRMQVSHEFAKQPNGSLKETANLKIDIKDATGSTKDFTVSAVPLQSILSGRNGLTEVYINYDEKFSPPVEAMLKKQIEEGEQKGPAVLQEDLKNAGFELPEEAARTMFAEIVKMTKAPEKKTGMSY